MISTSDAGERIKVYATIKNPDGKLARKYLGHIHKSDFTVASEIVEQISEHDLIYLEQIIDIYKQAAFAKFQATALNFPNTLQTIIKYFEGHATEAEKKLILQSIEDARRTLRKTFESNPQPFE